MEARSLKPLQLTGNVCENWRLWKQKFDIYAAVLELDGKPERIQCAHLIFQMGENVIDIFNSFTFTDDEKDKIEKLKEKFDNYFIPKKNLTYERYKFFTARQINEPIEEYVTSLKKQAEKCDFPGHAFKAELIKTMLIVGIRDEKVRQHLLHQEYTLEKAVEVCNLAQCSKEQPRNELSPSKQNESDDDNSNLEASVKKELNITKSEIELQHTYMKEMGSTEFQFTKTRKGCSSLQTMRHPLSVSTPDLFLKQHHDKQKMKVPRCHDENMEVKRSRSDATFRFSINKTSKMKGPVRSPPHYVRNLPWIIEAKKSKRGRYLNISLQCNTHSHSTSWSCYASAEVRLLPARLNKNIISDRVQRWFNYQDYDFSFFEFIEWDELLDVRNGYIYNDTITIEVYLRAHEPRGFR